MKRCLRETRHPPGFREHGVHVVGDVLIRREFGVTSRTNPRKCPLAAAPPPQPASAHLLLLKRKQTSASKDADRRSYFLAHDGGLDAVAGRSGRGASLGRPGLESPVRLAGKSTWDDWAMDEKAGSPASSFCGAMKSDALKPKFFKWMFSTLFL